MEENNENFEEKKSEDETSSADKEQNRKIKNLISAVIILGALFLGSLFVDVAQIATGKGYSARILEKTNIFEAAGKTWVAYTEPVVKMQVVNDDSCENCDPAEVLTFLQRIMPTIAVSKVDWQSDEGKALQEKFGLQYLPAFIFSEEAEKTEFFSQAAALFEKKDSDYLLNSSELGVQPGKFITTPAIGEGANRIGAADAKVKVIIYSDFQCPYSKMFYESNFNKAVSEFKDQSVEFIYKHLPLSFHPQAENASLASECAAEQGKFFDYAERLYAQQATWGNTEGKTVFKQYAASMGLNTAQFNTCLDSDKYKDKVNADAGEAASFGISGTPSTFINGDFQGGAISYDTLKASIEKNLQ